MENWCSFTVNRARLTLVLSASYSIALSTKADNHILGLALSAVSRQAPKTTLVRFQG